MRTFSERNPFTIGAIGLGITFAVMLLALNYDKLPFFHTGRTYSAYFAEAGGLVPGSAVQVSGFRAGQVPRRRRRAPR
jgi:phospholipid/cholesterol/gamma-HCH transport system substrate-binding protein